MTSEPLTTRLMRERLASLKKFIPVRDDVREKLQLRQQAQTDFSIGSEQLFAPVTKATKDVKLATERAIYGDIPSEGKRREVPLLSILDKVATDAGQAKEYLRTLPIDIVTTSQKQQKKKSECKTNTTTNLETH